MSSIRSLAISRAWELCNYVSFMEEAGVPWKAQAARLGLPVQQLPDPGLFVSTHLYTKLVGERALTQGIPDLGVRACLDGDNQLRLWQPTPALVQACLVAPSLYAGLRAICELSKSQWSSLQFWLRESEDAFWLCSRSPATLDDQGLAITAETRICQLAALIEQYLGVHWRPRKIWLQTQRQPSALFSEIMEGPRITLGLPCTAFPIEKMLLARTGPSSRAAGGLSGQAGGDCDAQHWDWLQRLRAVLPAYASGNQLSIEHIADLLSVHPRTLQRALAERRLTFRDLVDQARYEIAVNKLADPSLSVTDVSQSLGYSEPTNFTRAFHRISGQTPTQFRQGLLNSS